MFIVKTQENADLKAVLALTWVASMVLPPEKALAMAILSRMEMRGMMAKPIPTSDIMSLKL